MALLAHNTLIEHLKDISNVWVEIASLQSLLSVVIDS